MRIIISLHIQPKILRKSHVSDDILAKNWFLLIFMYIFNASNFLRARWLYDVTVMSYEVQWYLVSMDRGGPYLYNGSKYRVSGILYRKSREGLQQPPFRGRVTKNTSGGRGLMSKAQLSYLLKMKTLLPSASFYNTNISHE